MAGLRSLSDIVVPALALLLLTGCAAVCLGRGGDVIEEFEMAPCLGMLTVPVTCSGEDFEFLLDTGASACLVDKTLAPLLGASIGRTYVQTPTGVEAVDLYLPLEASVGRLRLDADEPVMCVDLSRLGRGSGRSVSGIIGMAFIRRFGLQLDFDNRTIRFLDSPLPLDGGYGTELELGLEPRGIPELTTAIADTTEWTFGLDTGCGPTGSMEHRLCERLLELGVLHPVGLARGGALTRSFVASKVVLDSLVVGPFTHHNLMLRRTEASVLGVPFLSQYTITFDFPERRVWFEPSSRDDAAPCLDLSGLSLAYFDDECVVAWVVPGSPAAVLGLEQGDAVLSVGEVSTVDGSVACLEAVLCQAMGDTLRLVASRCGEEFSGILDLRWEASESTLGGSEQSPD